MRLIITLLCGLVLASSNVCAAPDTPAAREAAVARYLQVVPVAAMLEETVSQIGSQLPPDVRSVFVERLHKNVRPEVLTAITVKAMVRSFSVDEINALTAFFSTKNGASAMRKLNAYTQEVAPLIQDELLRAISDSEQINE